jgi:hypothetical protein
VVSEREKPLRRWVRLKQAAKAAAQADGGMARSEPVPGSGASKASFDPASLPSIESIAANTDVVAFLQAGVPVELTRAALRRAWTSDPAIRDFIGIAENQWDFNDPNGIPGFGPLVPAEGGVDVLAQISTRLNRMPGTPEDLVAVAELVSVNADKKRFDVRVDASNSLLANPAAVPPEILTHEDSGKTAAANTTARSLRHGSALPR